MPMLHCEQYLSQKHLSLACQFWSDMMSVSNLGDRTNAQFSWKCPMCDYYFALCLGYFCFYLSHIPGLLHLLNLHCHSGSIWVFISSQPYTLEECMQLHITGFEYYPSRALIKLGTLLLFCHGALGIGALFTEIWFLD